MTKLSGTAQNKACQALVAAQSCSYHRQLKLCKQKDSLPTTGADVPDIEDFVSLSKTAQVARSSPISRPYLANISSISYPYPPLRARFTPPCAPSTLSKTAQVACALAM